MALVSEDDIRRAVSFNAFQAGRDYVARGLVRSVSVSPDGRMVQAFVSGTARAPYVLSIELDPDESGGAYIEGFCSCPVGSNCKHVAAALLAARNSAPAKARAITPSVAAQLALSPLITPPETRSELAPAPREPELPPHLQQWLDALQAAGQEDAGVFPDNVRQRLRYVLALEAAEFGPRELKVGAPAVWIRKGGAVTAGKDYAANAGGSLPKFVRSEDRAILRALGGNFSAWDRRWNNDADDRAVIDLLRRIIATGRAHWETADGPLVEEGPARPGRVVWRAASDGSQYVDVELDPGLLATFVPAGWYVDPASGRIGPVTLDIPRNQLRALLHAPAIPPEIVSQFRRKLSARGADKLVPLPEEMRTERVADCVPQPHLILTSGSLPTDPVNPSRSPGATCSVAIAHLCMRYGPVLLPALEHHNSVMQDGRVYTVERDQAAEAAAARTLVDASLTQVRPFMFLIGCYYSRNSDFVLRDPNAASYWAQFVMEAIPLLQEAGWTVEISSDFPFRMAEVSGEIIAALQEGSGIDWFDLELGAMVDGERIDLVPPLLDFIRTQPAPFELPSKRKKKKQPASFMLPLRDGRMLVLERARIVPILNALLELHAGGLLEPVGEKIGFARAAAADLVRFEVATGIVWRGGESLRALGRCLAERGGIPRISVPASFAAELRPYQARGVDWLQFLGGAGLGGVLADDMGLGKTVQTLAHLLIEREAGRLDRPALVICPTSLVPNWRLEAARFAPDLRVLVLHGLARKALFDAIPGHDLVITTYPLLSRDHDVLARHEWHVLVLDEAQTIKNPEAGVSRIVNTLKARQRIGLSGTPLENHLGELWSLFHFILPGFLGDRKNFVARYRTPIEKNGDSARRAVLAARVRPFLLRRTKGEVAAELPPKTEIVEAVEMEGRQKDLYESIRVAMQLRVRQAIADQGLAKSGIIILDALLKLRQACCDPRLVKLKAAKATPAESAKLDRLMEMLAQMLDEGRRVLLFSQFTSMLSLIEEKLNASQISYGLLTGETKDRAAQVARFQSGQVPVFLASLKAGGVGLNLTAADTVIHYDPWWNPAVEEQATDRAHRIGQDKAVFVHRLITLNTVEEKMDLLKERKRELARGILEEGREGTLALTEADVEALFAPAR